MAGVDHTEIEIDTGVAVDADASVEGGASELAEQALTAALAATAKASQRRRIRCRDTPTIDGRASTTPGRDIVTL